MANERTSPNSRRLALLRQAYGLFPSISFYLFSIA